MDLETIRHSQVSQKEKKQVPYMNAYVWNLEKWYRWAYLQSINKDTDIENKHMDPKVGGGWDELGNWEIDTYMYYWYYV